MSGHSHMRIEIQNR